MGFKPNKKFHPKNIFWEVQWWPNVHHRAISLDEIHRRSFNEDEEAQAMELATTLRDSGNWRVHVSRVTRECLCGWSAADNIHIEETTL